MAGKLKSLDVEREVKAGKYADGDGLYLIVAAPTSKNWSYRYWFKGKERWLGLGSFKDVSLKEARLARDAARLQVRAGVDVVHVKRSAREEQKAIVKAEKAKTFEECAQAYIDECWSTWSEKHRNQWPSSLKRYAYGINGANAKMRRKARSDWLALMPNTNEGYVSWEKAEAIRTMVNNNLATSPDFSQS